MTDVPGQQIEGWTAYRFTRMVVALMLVLMGACIAGVIISQSLILTGHDAYEPEANGFIVLAGLVVVAAFCILPSLATRRERAEVRRGYTTIRNRYIEVEQRSPRTGEVIRAAGQPILSAAELRQIVRGEVDLPR